jgi:hypothetical protein
MPPDDAIAHATAQAPAGHDAPLARDLIARQLARLERLSDIGMEVAEAAGRSAAALAGGGEAGAADPALAYARAARAVRLTIALQSRLMAELAALDGAEAKARAVTAARRRDRIHARVEQAIEADRRDAPDAEHDVETLSSSVWERLTEEDDADLLDRPMEEVVAQICRDLGLSPAWAALAPQPSASAPAPTQPDVRPFPVSSSPGSTGGPKRQGQSLAPTPERPSSLGSHGRAVGRRRP